MNLMDLRHLRRILVSTRLFVYRKAFGVDIDPSVNMSLSAKVDLTFPQGIHIGAHTYLAFDTHILAHDFTRGLYLHTRIGRNCFIGGRSIVMPGVEIGDGCIVGAGSVVTRNVPAGSIVAGNPATVLQSNVAIGRYGMTAEADSNEERLRSTDPEVGRMSSKERDARLKRDAGTS